MDEIIRLTLVSFFELMKEAVPYVACMISFTIGRKVK